MFVEAYIVKLAQKQKKKKKEEIRKSVMCFSEVTFRYPSGLKILIFFS